MKERERRELLKVNKRNQSHIRTHLTTRQRREERAKQRKRGKRKQEKNRI